MKYLKNIEKFLEKNSQKESRLIENVNYHITSVKNLGEVNLPGSERKF